MMNELNEKDWELINAYHDGELGDAERRSVESRLASEPLLEEALRDVSSVSASLGALRPDTHQVSSMPPAAPANQDARPKKWIIGGAVAAAIALAVAVGPQFFTAPSAFDIHADFAAQSFAVETGDLRTVAAGQNENAPDLASANLTAVAMQDVNDGHVTHYAGRNGCRLTYFRGTLSPGEQSPSAGMQVAEWSTANNMWHMIVATGMDKDKFNAIAAYLKLTTREQANEQMMATLAETTANAARCVG
ncbi:hypothetical protein A3734_17620 [Sulfitobacter sp. HI0054]|jgi:hypothetical protein|uniref:hypothetical protein n=1 Tax=Sulfitobacter sp. HI0054 TaxID=1822238 RepID=UPI0007C3034D|nr:hypothetical protein [Sulfitobacter sp. HI0054]KZY52899.1 hypothetical protein A3734_17620 [Sulfitobacter sp. HI0054]MAE92014.1 hypothetical protein [Pelagibaca sp.]